MRNENGSLLIMTMFAIGLLSTLVIGFLSISTSDLSISRQDAWSRQAEYAAEAGLMESMYQLSLNSDWTTGFTNTPLTTDQTYTVSVTNDNPSVTLNCTGTANGYTQQIQAGVTVVGSLPSGKYRLRLDTWELL